MTLNTKMKDGSEAECFVEVWRNINGNFQDSTPIPEVIIRRVMGYEICKTVAVFKIKLKPKPETGAG